MPLARLIADGQVIHDAQLLRELRGRRLTRELQVLCVIGAHRFGELRLINRLFPALRMILLFEPQPGPVQALRQLAAQDPRIRVFATAVSDTDGTAPLNVTSNDGESSSLLALGTHRVLFRKALSPALPGAVRLNCTEVSTQAVYESAGLLSEVEALLAPRSVNLGCAPLRADVPMHGNAVFVAQADREVALALTTKQRLRRGFHRFKLRVRGRAG